MSKINKIIQITLIITLLNCCSYLKTDRDKVNLLTASDEFVLGSEDIPLITNMDKYSNYNIDYDSGKGSIISVRYKSEDDIDDINLFYVTNLPYLGWKIDKVTKESTSFSRDSQNLEIKFIEGDENLVEFTSSSSL